MKTYSITQVALSGLAAMIVLTGLFIQGCSQSGSDQDFILGPSPIVSPAESGTTEAMSAPKPDGNGYFGDVNPVPQCELDRTAELRAYNETAHTFAVRINGEDRGLLLPKNGLKLTVKAGRVGWELIPIGSEGQYASGTLMADVCGIYRIFAPKPRQGESVQPIKNNDMMEGQSQDDPYNPFPPCEIDGTAEIVFLNFSVSHAYAVSVNGKDRGVLLPGGNLRVVIPEGENSWALYEKGNRDKPAFAGTIKAKRCASYTVKAGYEPRQPDDPQYYEE